MILLRYPAAENVNLPMTESYEFLNNMPVNQQIYRTLRQDIVTCVIPPGTLLSEKEISSRFNVSRQPVREAFIKLAEAGLVQVLPQRGTFVMKISAKRVADGRFIREAVETAVVRRAAVVATPYDLALLEHNLQRQRLAAKSQQTPGVFAAGRRVSPHHRADHRLPPGVGNRRAY